MFSLQKFFGKDQEFFDLLEASAKECRASVQALQRVIASGQGPFTLDEFAASRRKEKQINTQITELLSRLSVTAMEPEDIEALSNSLYKIPKTVEKFAERFMLGSAPVRTADFSGQIKLLEEAIGIIGEMLKELRKDSTAEKLAEQNARLQRVEGEADKLMLDLLKDLYNRRDHPVEIIILKDLYELLERVVDRCRDVGNVISNIALKNS